MLANRQHGWLASRALGAIACADMSYSTCMCCCLHTQLQTIQKAVFYLLKTTNAAKQGAWLAGKQGC